MTKKDEPNVLDRLFNVAVSDREVKGMLREKAKQLVEEQFKEGYSESAARATVSEKLTDWMHISGFSGRGRKKMVDKAVARALKGYEDRLRLALLAEARRLKKTGHWVDESNAKRIFEKLQRGQVGKERHQKWPKYRRR